MNITRGSNGNEDKTNMTIQGALNQCRAMKKNSPLTKQNETKRNEIEKDLKTMRLSNPSRPSTLRHRHMVIRA